MLNENCPHCGSDKGTWFSRVEPMGNICEKCGMDVDSFYFIIHDKCGLDIELCQCPDSSIKDLDAK